MPHWLNDWLPAIQTLLIPVLGVGVKVLNGIRSEIHELRTLVAKMQQWREDHETMHGNESDRLNREFDQIHSRLRNGNGKDYPHD